MGKDLFANRQKKRQNKMQLDLESKLILKAISNPNGIGWGRVQKKRGNSISDQTKKENLNLAKATAASLTCAPSILDRHESTPAKLLDGTACATWQHAVPARRTARAQATAAA